MQLAIDPEFKALIPPLTPAERETLDDNVRASGGPIDPIHVWRGTVIDGHNRYEICQAHGLPFKTIEHEFADRDTVKAWMLANQLGRRNLTNDQVLMICAEAGIEPPQALRSSAAKLVARELRGTPFSARVIAGKLSLRSAKNDLRRQRGETVRAPAPRTAPAPAETGHTIIIPDLHAPYHDQRAWGVCLAAIEVVRPETVVVIGDFADCYSVSAFDKSPERNASLKDEAELVRKEFARLMRVVPENARVIYCEGNHERRFDKYITRKAPELHGLLSMRDLLVGQHPRAEWIAYGSYEKVGRVIYTHDVGYSGVYAARHSLVKAGTNIVFGHTHRGGLIVDGDHQGDRRFSLNVGWLGDLKQIDYTHRINTQDWATGFGYIYTDAETGMVWPSFVPILAGRCRVAGRTVRA